MKPSALLGLGLVILVAAAVLVYPLVKRSGGPSEPTGGGGGKALTELSGKVGGEKMGFLQDPAVQKILAKHGLTVHAVRAGSVEMVREPSTGQQFLWPASSFLVDHHRELGNLQTGSEDIFNSPIVLYSWRPVADALVSAGIVTQEMETYYVDGLSRLIDDIEAGRTWSDIGLPKLHGRISIIATDPIASNSGLTFAGLLANTMNGGEVVDPASVDSLLPAVAGFFTRMGMLEHSSGTLFTKFLNQGVGAYPIIVGYENQLVEFTLENPQLVPKLRSDVCVLYPRPTCWASHPLIALDGDGKRLIEVLQDKEVLEIAWERHGFRSAFGNDTNVLQIGGMPQQITSVQPLPGASVMTKLLEYLDRSL